MLGKLTCLVSNLHVGSLKKFGYSSAMLDGKGKNAPSFIEVDKEELLEDPQIKSALSAGVLIFEPYYELFDTEEFDQEDFDSPDLSFNETSDGEELSTEEDNEFTLKEFEEKLNELDKKEEKPKKNNKENKKSSNKSKKNDKNKKK